MVLLDLSSNSCARDVQCDACVVSSTPKLTARNIASGVRGPRGWHVPPGRTPGLSVTLFGMFSLGSKGGSDGVLPYFLFGLGGESRRICDV